MIDANNLDEPQQLTFNESSQRILDYQTTLDGRIIAYTKYDSSDTDNNKLIVLDVDAKSQTEIASCSQPEAHCYSFALSPSGDFLVYYYNQYPTSREIRLVDLREIACAFLREGKAGIMVKKGVHHVPINNHHAIF